MKNLTGAFIVLLVGYVTSIVAFIFERITSFRSKVLGELSRNQGRMGSQMTPIPPSGTAALTAVQNLGPGVRDNDDK